MFSSDRLKPGWNRRGPLGHPQKIVSLKVFFTETISPADVPRLGSVTPDSPKRTSSTHAGTPRLRLLLNRLYGTFRCYYNMYNAATINLFQQFKSSKNLFSVHLLRNYSRTGIVCLKSVRRIGTVRFWRAVDRSGNETSPSTRTRRSVGTKTVKKILKRKKKL